MGKPLVSIGLVTYNSAPSLNSCLNSIARHCPIDQIEIMVVDNDSDDSTVQILKEIPFISKLIKNEKNTGFASGVNRLMAERTGRHLLLLNPDCELDTPILQTINGVFTAGPRVGIIGANILDMDGNPREAYGAFITPAMVRWDFSGLRKILPRKNWSTSIPFKGGSPIEVDYPTGAFYCIRDEAINSVGAFDARFFAYFEEVDYALRLKEKGYKSILHPSIKVKHLGGGSFASANSRYDGDFHLTCYLDSLLWFLEKHYGKWQSECCRRFIRNSAAFKAAFGGNTEFGYRHRQVVRILDKLKNSDLRRIYDI